MSNHSLFDYVFKYVIIGDSGVGKSSFLNRVTKDTFHSNYQYTVGVDFASTTLTINNKKVKLQMWDTAGQERYRSIVKSYYRDCAVCFIMYDVTNQDSFDNLQYWINELRENNTNDYTEYVLLSNKIDLSDQAVVDIAFAKNLANQYNMLHFEISVKDDTNVHNCLQVITSKLVDKLNKRNFDDKSKHLGIQINLNPKKEYRCCNK